MFTKNDVQDIFRLFPPQKSSDFLPSLILSAGGHGFVTLQFVQAHFRSRVTSSNKRISQSDLASELDVDQALVRQLVRNHPKLALHSADGASIIPADERDALQQELAGLLSSGLVSEADFVSRNNVHTGGFEILLNDQEAAVSSIDGYAYTKSYETQVARALTDLTQQSLENVHAIDIKPEDLPDAPPIWFISRTLEQILVSQDLDSRISVQQIANRVTCTPKQLTERKRDAAVWGVQSGAVAYLDLQKFVSDFPELFASYEDAVSYFKTMPDTQVLDAFVVSRAWVAELEENCVRILEQEGCTLDVAEMIGSRLPSHLRDQIAKTAEESIITTLFHKSGLKILRTGSFLLTESRRDQAIDELCAYAKSDAATQWHEMKSNPERAGDVKFNLSKVTIMIPEDGRAQNYLIKEKAVERLLDEQFWTGISEKEAENELEFATYFVDRVLSRYQVYNNGLSAVLEQGLRDQLDQLFATYAQKDLIPDAITKARAQGLLSSRKTRKNVSRLEAIFEREKDKNTSALLAALEKFSKKQNITTPDSASLGTTKKGMVDDMLRRMQKQKPSDGPVLFLTLVVVLFARYYDGVIYATGKYAPKLLKQLKGHLETGQYEQVEKWKQAAKTGSLSAGDKAEMVKMAEG